MNYTSADELCNFKCSICSKVLSVGPVLLQADGKNICGRCPHPAGEAYVNYLYERLVSKYAFPCIYQGCTDAIPWDKVATHEENCSYKPFSCIIEECPWAGNKTELVSHFRESHPESLLEGKEEFEMDLAKDQKVVLLNYWSNIPFIIRALYDHSNDTLCFSAFHIGNLDNTNELSFKVKVRAEEGVTVKNIIKEILEFGKTATGSQNSVSFHSVSPLLMKVKAFCSFKLRQGKKQIKSKSLKELQKVKCNICKNHVANGVHLCKNQHMVCKNCKCSCQHPPKYIDIHGFQKVGDDIVFPCSHKECPHAYRKPEIERHISECVYRHFKCEKCDYLGKFSDLVSHCRANHDAKMSSDFKWFAHIEAEKMRVVMIAEGYIFYFTREIRRNSSLDYCITFEVRKFAVVDQKKFRYKIELKNHEDSSANLLLEGKEQESGFIGGFIVKDEDMKNFLDENNEICYRIIIVTCVTF